jgi:hypothetical protein
VLLCVLAGIRYGASMGDYFQTIVDKDVSEDEAPQLAERVREWLVSRRIIEPELSDSALSEPGHRPGPVHSSALENPSSDALDAETNGLQFQVGRTVFWTNFEDLTCRACAHRFEPGEGWSAAVDAWYEGDDSVTFPCPKCGQPERLVDWDGEFPWGFGNLGLTFWNWPPLSASFVREVTELLGHRSVLVRGKL